MRQPKQCDPLAARKSHCSPPPALHNISYRNLWRYQGKGPRASIITAEDGRKRLHINVLPTKLTKTSRSPLQ